MPSLDLAMLREISREKAFWWGGLDPRVSTEVIARRLKVAGSTVRRRLAEWEESGFLKGYDVIPNPNLFGASLAGGSLRVEAPRLKPGVIEDLALVDGIKGAIDHVGEWLAIVLVPQNDRDLERLRRLIARLPGVAEISPCEMYRAPPCALVPTPLDWRLLAALRATPRAPVSEIAENVGISARTFTRRYAALVKSQAVLFWLLLDFSKFPGVVGRVIVDIEEGASRREIAEDLRRVFPDLVELWTPRESFGGPEELDVLLSRESVPQMEDAEQAILAIRGVASVETLYPRTVRAYGGWVDARIADVLGKNGGRKAPDPPRA